MARDATNLRDKNIALNLERAGFSAMFGSRTVLPRILVFVPYFYITHKAMRKQQVVFRIGTNYIWQERFVKHVMSFKTNHHSHSTRRKSTTANRLFCWPIAKHLSPVSDVNISAVSSCYGPVREAKGFFQSLEIRFISAFFSKAMQILWTT